MSRYFDDKTLRRLSIEVLDAQSRARESEISKLARDISNRRRRETDGAKRRTTNINLAGTRAGESRTGALAAYLAEDGQRTARGRGSLPGTSRAPASSYLTGGGQSASQTSYGARAGGSRTEALAAGLAQKDGPPTVPERLGAAAKSIGYSLAGSVPMLGSLAKQYDANRRADLVNPERQALLNENETLNNRLNAIRQGYGNAAWGTEAGIRAQMDANRARLQGDLRTSDIVKSGLGLELMRKSGEQQERALEGTTGIPRFLGSNAISIANNAPAMLTGPFAPLVMSIQAAAQKGYELNEQGLAPEEALVRGAVSGGIEALTEKYSVENFWKIAEGTGAKTAIKNLWRQAGVEASEESASYALNYLADKAARDPEATFSLSELAESAAGGALSGGFYGGVGLAVNRLGQARTGSQSEAVRQDPAAQRNAAPMQQQVVNTSLLPTVQAQKSAAEVQQESASAVQAQNHAAPVRQTEPEAGVQQQARQSISLNTNSNIESDNRYSDSLGENGQKNLRWLQERTGRNDRDFLFDHWTYYKMGREGANPAVLDQLGVTGTLSRDEASAAFTAGHNDGVAEAADTVQKLFEGRTVGDRALDRALAFPDGRKAIERITGELPKAPAEARQTVRRWISERAKPAAVEEDFAAEAISEAAQDSLPDQPDVPYTAEARVEQGAPEVAQEQFGKDADSVMEPEAGDDGKTKPAADFSKSPRTESGLRRNEYSGRLDAMTAGRLDNIAKRAGVSVEISDKVGATGSYQDGRILIRADAENPVRQVFVHELTHHLETSGEYQALSDLVVKRLQETGTDVELALAGITQEYRRNGTLLTEDGARRELVAQFAEENLFTSERSIRQLAQEKRSVAQRIRDWLHDLITRFSGSKGDREAARFLQDAEKLYQKALDSAEGRQDGRVQYLIFTADESLSSEGAPKRKAINNELLEKVVANADIIEQNGIIYELSGDEFETLLEGQRLSDAVADYYKSIGGVVERLGFGKVLIAKRGVKSSISHGFGETKRAAFAAVPEVIRSGVQIDFQQNWKGRKEDSYVFAGRVTVNGKPHDMAVVVMKNSQSSRFYLHEIIAIEKDGSASFMTGSRQSGGLIGDAKTSSSENSISQPETDSKQNLDGGGQKSHGQSLGEMNERLAQLNDEEKQALKAENQRLQKRVETLQNQLKRTPPERRSAEQIRKVAREVLADYESKADAAAVREQLTGLYEKMHKGASADELYVEASQIAAGIVQESQHLDDEAYKQYQGLRKQLRETRLTLSETDRPSIAEGYNEFRKRNRGRLLLTNDGMPVDTLYSELCQSYPEFFSDEITHPADQLERISDVLDSLKPVYENPYSNALGEAANTLALDLLERGASVPAAKPTTADRFAETLQKERRGNQMLMQDNEQQNQRIEALKQDQARVNAELEAEKKRRENDLEALKKHYEEVDKRRRERAGDRLEREMLLRVAKRVKRMKAAPQNRAQIEEIVNTLDTFGIAMREGTRINLQNLQVKIAEQRRLDPDWDPPQALLDQIDRISKDKRQIGDLDIRDVEVLTAALMSIENSIHNENRLLRKQERREVYAQAKETVNSIQQAKAPRNNEGLKNLYLSQMLSPERFVRRLVGYDESSPMYELTKDLSDGQRKAQRFEMESERYFDKWHSNKKFMEKISGKKAKRIEVQGMAFVDGELKPVTTYITPAQQITLLLNKRHAANRAHITEGGVILPDVDLYCKGKLTQAFSKSVHFRLDEAGLRQLTSNMDSDLLEYANAISNYLNGMAKDAINETSVTLDGFERASVLNYFPIRTDPNFSRTENENVKRDASLESMGILQNRTGGLNPILIEDVTDVVKRHMENTAYYYGLTIPVRNFNKLWNVTGQGSAWSVKRAVQEKWGSSALTYINEMLADVQGSRKGQQGWLGRQFAALRSKSAGAVLTVNTSVIMKQAASYPTAAGELGWTPLLKALSPQAFTVDMDVIAKYTPDYWYRRKGYSTTELGDITSRKQGLPKALNLIQGVDLATTRTLWLASEYYVREQNKGKANAPAIRSDAYYQQVAEAYNCVIEKTQPNYSAMQRPAILRTQNELVKSTVMFKTQSFQNFNMMYDAFGSWRTAAERYRLTRNRGSELAAKYAQAKQRGDRLAMEIAEAEMNRNAQNVKDTKADLAERWRNFVRNAQAQAVSAAVLSGMSLLNRMLLGRMDDYKDDEGELTVFSVLKQVAKDFASSLAGSALFGSTAFAAIDAIALGGTWFDLEAGGIGVINDVQSRMQGVVKAWQNLWAVYSDEDKELTPADWLNVGRKNYALAKIVAEGLGGVPVGSLEKIVTAITGRVARKLTGDEDGTLTLLLLNQLGYNDEKNSTEKELRDKADSEENSEVNELFRAAYEAKRDGDDAALDEAREELRGMEYTEEEIDKGIKNRADEARREKQDYQDTQSDIYTEAYDAAAAEQGFQTLDRVHREALKDVANEYSKALADEQYIKDYEGVPSWVTSCREAPKTCGLSESQFMVARAATRKIEGIPDPDEDGSSIKNSKSFKIMQAIYQLPGLNDKQRAYLFEACGVGKSVRRWNRTKVEQELDKMEELAEKGGARATDKKRFGQ